METLRKVNRKGWFFTDYFLGGSGALTDLGGPYVYKHFNVANYGSDVVEGKGTGDFLNFSIIRFAEVLLIFAEASNEISGPNADSLNAVKRIRDRAGLAYAKFLVKGIISKINLERKMA